MVRILGLDPGSRITGYGVVDAGRQGVRYVASGCIRVGEGQMAGRLLAMVGTGLFGISLAGMSLYVIVIVISIVA